MKTYELKACLLYPNYDVHRICDDTNH